LLPIYHRYAFAVPGDNIGNNPDTDAMDLKSLCQIGIAAEIVNVRLHDEVLLPRATVYPDIERMFRMPQQTVTHVLFSVAARRMLFLSHVAGEV
jgi:hypothetical protein